MKAPARQFAAATDPFLNRTRLRQRCWCRRHRGSAPDFLDASSRNVERPHEKAAWSARNDADRFARHGQAESTGSLLRSIRRWRLQGRLPACLARSGAFTEWRVIRARLPWQMTDTATIRPADRQSYDNPCFDHAAVLPTTPDRSTGPARVDLPGGSQI
jgi:hypothetical protein